MVDLFKNWKKLDTLSKDPNHIRIEIRKGKMTFLLYEKNTISRGKNEGTIKKKLIICNYKCMNF